MDHFISVITIKAINSSKTVVVINMVVILVMRTCTCAVGFYQHVWMTAPEGRTEPGTVLAALVGRTEPERYH